MNSKLYINSIYNVLYKVLNVFFPLISASYVSHILLASGVGKIASAQNIAQYFIIIASLGLPGYGTREIAKVRDSKEKTNKLFSELFIINLIPTLLCSLVYYSIVLVLPFFRNNDTLYFILGLNIVFNVINVDWYYQGTEEYKYIAVRSFVIKIVSLFLLFIFVRTENDCNIYATILVATTVGNYVMNIYNLYRKQVRFTNKNLCINKHIKPVFILLCTTLATELYTLLDTTMITFMCSEQSVAYYTNSVKIVRVLITAVSAIGGVLLPRLSYYKEHNMLNECNEIVSKVFYSMLFIFLPAGCGIILVSNELPVVLFGVTFAPSAITLRIVALLIYTLGVSNLFGTQVLLTFEQEKKLLICTIVGAVSNICMNLFLIPRYQQNGAAVASVISELFVTILSYLFAKKFIKLNLEMKGICISFLGCIGMVLSSVIIDRLTLDSLSCMIVKVLICVLVYLFLNIILKNPIINTVVNIKRKGSKNV